MWLLLLRCGRAHFADVVVVVVVVVRALTALHRLAHLLAHHVALASRFVAAQLGKRARVRLGNDAALALDVVGAFGCSLRNGRGAIAERLSFPLAGSDRRDRLVAPRLQRNGRLARP